MRITVMDWKTDFRLCENFMGDKYAEDSYAARVIGVDIMSLKTAEENAKALADHVLTNAKEFVWRLSEYEMKMVRVLVDAGHGKAVRFQQSDCMIPMCLIDIANVLTSVEEERTTVWMADELLDAITPFVKELDGNEEYEHQKELERYVIGLTCLYGSLLKGEVKQLLEDFYEDEDVEMALTLMDKNLINTICVTPVEVAGKRDTMYYPPYINIIEDTPMHCYHSRLRRDVRQDFKNYDFEQILAAGDVGDIKIPNSAREKLIRNLMKFAGSSRPRATWDTFFIWITAVTGAEPRDLIDRVLGWCEPSKQKKILQKVLVQYLNNMPQWVLKGYSAIEMMAIDRTKVGITARFGDNRYGPEIEGAKFFGNPEIEDIELFGDVEIERLDDDFDPYYNFGGFPRGEA